MRQLVWSPALLVMTTSRRSSRHFTGFHFVSEWSLTRRCRYGSVCTRLHDAAPRYLTELCVGGRRRLVRTVVASLALESPGLSWCFGLGSLLLRLTRTWNRLPTTSDHQNCRSLHSSASSRPTCSSTRQCWLQLCLSYTIVRRCCGCTTSSAPTTNVQTRLDSMISSSDIWPNPVNRIMCLSNIYVKVIIIYVFDTVAKLPKCWLNLKQSLPEWKVNSVK